MIHYLRLFPFVITASSAYLAMESVAESASCPATTKAFDEWNLVANGFPVVASLKQKLGMPVGSGYFTKDGATIHTIARAQFNKTTCELSFRRVIAQHETQWFLGTVSGDTFNGRFAHVQKNWQVAPTPAEYRYTFTGRRTVVRVYRLPGRDLPDVARAQLRYAYVSNITKGHNIFLCPDADPVPDSVPVQKLLIGGRLVTECRNKIVCRFPLDARAAQEIGLDRFRTGVPAELAYAASPSCDRVVFFEYVCKQNPSGEETKRYARAELKKGLPQPVTFSCDDNYIDPIGVDPKGTGETGYIFPTTGRFGSFSRRLGLIKTSKQLVAARTLRIDAYGVKQEKLVDLRKRLPQVGRLRPLDQVLGAIKNLVAAGKLPAEEKKETKDIAAYECPQNPLLSEACRKIRPGGRWQGICAVDTSRVVDPPCVFPHHQYEELMPEIQAFARLLFHKRLKPLVAELRAKRDTPAADALDKEIREGTYFENFSCRLVSKYMPGFAKIERVQPEGGISVAGDWEKPVPEGAALEKEIGRPSGKAGAAKAYEGPERKEEVVEKCTVTHPQLEATLKKDLALIGADLPKTSEPGRYNSAAVILSALGGLPGNPDPFSNAPDPFAAPGRGDGAATSALKDVFKSNVELSKSLHIDAETFHTIADRLIGFYRKGGKARAFDMAATEMRGKTKLQIPRGTAAPQADIDAQNKSIDAQTRREGLRREVDQWSDAWEYSKLTGYIRADRFKSLNVYGRYKEVEKVVGSKFWGDCNELWDVCKKPVTTAEMKACIKCAYQAVFETCADGKVLVNAQTKQKSCANRPPNVTWFDFRSGAKNSKPFPGPGSRTVVTPKIGGIGTTLTFNVPRALDGNTVRNWMTSRLYQAVTEIDNFSIGRISGEHEYRVDVFGLLARRSFLPIGKSGADAELSNQGYQMLEQLPLTPWQKCYLWSGTVQGTCGLLSWSPPGNADGVKIFVKSRWPADGLANSPLFNLALTGEIKSWFDGIRRGVKSACSGRPPVEATIWGKNYKGDCEKWPGDQRNASEPEGGGARMQLGEKRLFEAAGRLADASGFSKPGGAGDVGGAIADVLGPIMGKVVSLLIKGDIEQVIKVLAKAAGLTPEQAVDCEDPEYRRETMKLGCEAKGGAACTPAGDTRACCSLDNKRGCLTKVFAKNFVDMLESIIVMIGNKLVDWGVDALRAALEGVKIALVSAAGSVPYVGGVLASAVEIAWEVLMNFGAKALLKGLVVSQLPEWLHIKDLANMDLDALIEKHPIIALVAGIILDLITQAMSFGDKGPLEIGFASVMNLIQNRLQQEPQKNAFWIRAFIFAKKEMVAHSQPGLSIADQIKGLVFAMAKGFAAALGAKMDSESRPMFETAVARFLEWIKGFNFSAEVDKFTTNPGPIAYLVDKIGTYLVPVAIPLITSFVEMPEWAKKALGSGGRLLFGAIEAWRSGTGLDKAKVKEILDVVVVAVRDGVVATLDFPSDSIRKLTLDVYNWVTDLFRSGIDGGAAAVRSAFSSPQVVLAKFMSWFRELALREAPRLLAEPGLEPERALLEDGLGLLFDLIDDRGTQVAVLGATAAPRAVTGNLNDTEQQRQQALVRAFPKNQLPPAPALPAMSVLLARVSDFVSTYAEARLTELVKGTGFEDLARAAIQALFGAVVPGRQNAAATQFAGGLFSGGQRASADWTTWLRTNAGEVVGRVVIGLKRALLAYSRKLAFSPVGVSAVESILDGLGETLLGGGPATAWANGDLVRAAAAAARPLVVSVVNAIGRRALEKSGATPQSASLARAQAHRIFDKVIAALTDPALYSGAAGAGWARLSADSAFAGDLRGLAQAFAKTVTAADAAAVGRVLGEIVEDSVPEAALKPLLKQATTEVFAVLAGGSGGLAAFAASRGPEATRLFGSASTLRAIVVALVNALLSRSDGQVIKSVVDGAVGAVFDFLSRGFSTGGDLATLGSGFLTTLITSFDGFVRGRVSEAFPEGIVKTFVLDGLTKLADLARTVTGGSFNWSFGAASGSTPAKALLAATAKAVLDLFGGVLISNINSAPIKTLVGGFKNLVADLLADWENFRANANNIGFFWGKIVDQIVGPFLDEALVTRFSGVVQQGMQFMVNGLKGILKNPSAFLTDLESIGTANWSKDAAKKIVITLVGTIANTFESPVIKGILKQAVKYVTDNQGSGNLFKMAN